MARAQTRSKRNKHAAPAAANRAAQSRSAMGRMMAFTVVVVAPFVTPASIMVAIGLLPTLVAYLVDRDPEKYAPFAVGGGNLAGLVPYLFVYWDGPHTFNAAFAVIADVSTLIVVYVPAALGWVMHSSMPTVAAIYLKVSTDSRIQHMVREQEQLVRIWGDGLNEDPSENVSQAAASPAAR